MSMSPLTEAQYMHRVPIYIHELQRTPQGTYVLINTNSPHRTKGSEEALVRSASTTALGTLLMGCRAGWVAFHSAIPPPPPPCPLGAGSGDRSHDPGSPLRATRTNPRSAGPATAGRQLIGAEANQRMSPSASSSGPTHLNQVAASDAGCAGTTHALGVPVPTSQHHHRGHSKRAGRRSELRRHHPTSPRTARRRVPGPPSADRRRPRLVHRPATDGATGGPA